MPQSQKTSAKNSAEPQKDQEKFLIKGLGGKRALKGSITVSGAKNGALPLMAAALLFRDEMKLANVPDIEDVHRMRELLDGMGVPAERLGPHEYLFATARPATSSLDHLLSKRMRASILLSGPALARFGEVSFSYPGGCLIGARPIDFFLDGFRRMGASITEEDERFHIKASGKKLHGAEIFFPFSSCTGTETFMMAGVLAEGKTVIKNAAMEPEIPDIANFLNQCGAKISGAGTTTIAIEGGGLLTGGGKMHSVIPDRIETGSFAILAALLGEKVIIKDCKPEHVEALLTALESAGAVIESSPNSLIISANKKIKHLKAVNIRTHEYPGFATDIQAPMVVLLTQAEGESRVLETIYEGRLGYTEDLQHMGANITVFNPREIMVKGPTPLKGRSIAAPDLRAGLAFVIAALVARGESTINNAYFIDRGYEQIEKRLSGIGAEIERVR